MKNRFISFRFHWNFRLSYCVQNDLLTFSIMDTYPFVVNYFFLISNFIGCYEGTCYNRCWYQTFSITLSLKWDDVLKQSSHICVCLSYGYRVNNNNHISTCLKHVNWIQSVIWNWKNVIFTSIITRMWNITTDTPISHTEMFFFIGTLSQANRLLKIVLKLYRRLE